MGVTCGWSGWNACVVVDWMWNARWAACGMGM